jgi:hypothetical protein
MKEHGLHVCDSVHIPALPPDPHKTVRVIDRSHHYPLICQEREEEFLLVLRAPCPHIDAIIATAGCGCGYIDVKAVTLYE